MIKFISKILISLTLALVTTSSFCQTKLTTSAFLDSVQSPNALLLDVRTAKEFESGSIGNAKNIDWNDRDSFEAYINTLNRKQPIYLFCLSGGRSAKAADYLTQKGFSVFELQGGFLKFQNEQTANGIQGSNEGISLSKFQDIIKSNPKVLVDFTAEWCAPCRIMRPFLDEIDRDQHNGVKVVFIDADKNRHLLKLLGISGIPRIQLFKKGKLVWDHTGAIEKNELLEAVKKI